VAQEQRYPIRIVISAPAGRKGGQPEETPSLLWDQMVTTILREFPRTGPVAQFVRQPRSLEISLYTFTSEQETWLNSQVRRWEAHTDVKAPELLTDEQRAALARLADAESELSILQERYGRMVEEMNRLEDLTEEHFSILVVSGESLTTSDGWHSSRESLWSWRHTSGEQGHGFHHPNEARLAGIRWSVLHERGREPGQH